MDDPVLLSLFSGNRQRPLMALGTKIFRTPVLVVAEITILFFPVVGRIVGIRVHAGSILRHLIKAPVTPETLICHHGLEGLIRGMAVPAARTIQ